MTNTEKWLSVEEISDHLGISKKTVYRWLDRGKIPSNRIGKLWKFKASEVDEWVKTGGATDNHRVDHQIRPTSDISDNRGPA